MPFSSLFMHSWFVDTQHILFPCIAIYNLWHYVQNYCKKKNTHKKLLMTEVTFSLKALSLRRKGPFMALHVPSVTACIVALHSFLQLPSPLLLHYQLFLISLLLFPFILSLLFLSMLLLLSKNSSFFVVVGILNSL